MVFFKEGKCQSFCFVITPLPHSEQNLVVAGERDNATSEAVWVQMPWDEFGDTYPTVICGKVTSNTTHAQRTWLCLQCSNVQHSFFNYIPIDLSKH